MLDQKTESIVGQQIRKLRKQRGLSLRALADLCGISANAISLIERRENSPNVSSLHRMAIALNVPITDFFYHENEPILPFHHFVLPSIKKKAVLLHYSPQESPKGG